MVYFVLKVVLQIIITSISEFIVVSTIIQLCLTKVTLMTSNGVREYIVDHSNPKKIIFP